jgi:UDP-glucuronate decarboxylase
MNNDDVYLITGGAGFLGSHLCKRLLEQHERVVAVDNLSSSTGANLDELNTYEQFEFIKHDVTHELNYIMKDYGIKGIFNLACPASPPFYQNMPIETTLTCVLGAHHALSLATERGCRILQSSTSEVYGSPETSPQPETYRGSVNCFGPRACYDEGKRAAEALFYDYRKQNGTDIRVVRIFNTYGPNMCANDGRVVSNFIVQALANKPITVYGNGEQTRSFCYVDDLITAILAMWNSNYTSPVNIGNPGEFTMLELAQRVIRITGSKSEIKFMELPTDDPLQRRPDITLARSLGWSGPNISLDIGLGYTVEYFNRLLNLTRHFRNEV